jgi:transposase-like protein
MSQVTKHSEEKQKRAAKAYWELCEENGRKDKNGNIFPTYGVKELAGRFGVCTSLIRKWALKWR